MSPSGGRPAPAVDDDQRTSVQAIVLIVVAVVIGVLLLALGFDKEGGVVDTASSEATTTTTVSDGATAPPTIATTTTTTPPVTQAPASVSIVVANASGGSGQAGKAQTSLEAKGYTDVETSNAAVTPTSTVYFAEGAEGDARAVAGVLGIAEGQVKAMPASPPAPLNGATVLVVIGSDKL